MSDSLRTSITVLVMVAFLPIAACQTNGTDRVENSVGQESIAERSSATSSTAHSASAALFQVAATGIRIVPLAAPNWLSVDSGGVTLWKDKVPTRKASFRCFPNCVLSQDKQWLSGQRGRLSLTHWRVEKNDGSYASRLPPFSQIDYWHPSPDGKQVFAVAVVRRRDLRTAGEGVESRFVATKNGKSMVEIPTKGNSFSAWSNKHLAVTHDTDSAREVQIRERSTLKVVSRFGFGKEYINALIFSSDGSRLFAKTSQTHAGAWDLKGNLLAEWQTAKQIWSFDTNAAGDKVALATADRLGTSGSIEIWSVETPSKKLRTFAIPQRPNFVVWKSNQLWVGGTDVGPLHDNRIFRLSYP